MSNSESSRHVPSYRRLRRETGRDLAFVELNGRRHYLGPYDTPPSREKYHRMIAEWEAAGGVLPARPTEITVVELGNQFLRWSRGYYVKGGKVTKEPVNIGLAIRPLVQLYGRSSP
ncbi:MAG: hypothetical protein ACE15C_09860 [Phycisphaerae bacterium]